MRHKNFWVHRIFLLKAFFFIGFLVIWVRVGYLVGPGREALYQFEESRYLKFLNIEPLRPTIKDREGRDLAFSVPVYSLYVDPILLESKDKWLRKIHRVLKIPLKDLRRKLEGRQRFVWIKRQLSKREKADLDTLKLPSPFGFIKEYQRVYPAGDILRPVLGFVGREGQGLSGVEYWIDRSIGPRVHQEKVFKDAHGRILQVNDDLLTSLVQETEIYFAFDLESQVFFEQRLRAAVNDFKAKAAFALALDLKSHDFLTLAYVENDSVKTEKILRNPFLVDGYEFGSIIKPLLVAYGLEKKWISPNTIFDLDGGRIRVDDRVIRESHYDPLFPRMSLAEVISKSSNVAMAKLGLKLGSEKVYEALSSFGFGQKPRLGLGAESAGVLPALPWRNHFTAAASIGQGWSASPIQVMVAWSTLITGMRFQPKIVKEIAAVVEAPMAYPIEEHKTQKVLSDEVVSQMKQWLKLVVSPRGTGRRAAIPGYSVAGKTGTAQKPDPQKGGYKDRAYLASFVGVTPADEPRFLILVSVDEPQGLYYGGDVAAPVFADLGLFLLKKYGIAPDLPNTWNIPPLAAQVPKSHIQTGGKIQLSSDLSDLDQLGTAAINRDRSEISTQAETFGKDSDMQRMQ